MSSAIRTFFLVRKYRKQAEAKEGSYKKVLAKHNAIIKELDARSKMDRERQDRLLAYDSKLKREMDNQQAKIRELKKQIAELEEKKADDE